MGDNSNRIVNTNYSDTTEELNRVIKEELNDNGNKVSNDNSNEVSNGVVSVSEEEYNTDKYEYMLLFIE